VDTARERAGVMNLEAFSRQLATTGALTPVAVEIVDAAGRLVAEVKFPPS
jgi:hypothetical protein